MKQYRTRFLKSIAVFFITFPLTHLVFAATLFDIPFNSCMTILLSPLYYVVSVLGVFVGYGLWEMSRWSWYLLLLLQVLVAYENAVFILSYGQNHHKAFAYLLSILVQWILVLRVAREIRVPYFFPKIRWWESNPRYRLSFPAEITRKEKNEVLNGEVLDIAMSGCFVKLRSDVSPNETVLLRFKIFDFEFQFEGIIVWFAQSAVTHPKGMGVKFGPISKSQRRALRSVSRRLKRVSDHYRKYRYLMNPEDFLKRMEELEKVDSESIFRRDSKKAQNVS